MDDEKRAEEIQLVIFNLANEEYAIPIIHVHEIIKLIEITRIPGMPDFVEGVVNLRGKITPVIDIRKRFKLEQKEADEDNRIIIVDVGYQTVGLVVDSVSEVIRLSTEAIDPVPSTIAKISSEYLKGIGKEKERLLIILDIKKMLSELEKVSLEKVKEKLTELEKKEEIDQQTDREQEK